MDKHDINRPVKTTGTVDRILAAIKTRDGATVSELADSLDLSVSTVHDHVSTLHTLEYLTRDGDRYEIGLKLLDYGMFAREKNRLVQIAKPMLEELSDKTDESVWLIVEEHGRAIYADKVLGEKGFRTIGRVGYRTYLHCLAGGKCMLAYMDQSDVERIVQRHGLPAQTSQTITETDTLFDELNTIRERGYAYSEGEEVEGLRAVGAAVTHDSTVVGALSIAGPESRLKGDYYRTQLPEYLTESINTIELRMKYS